MTQDELKNILKSKGVNLTKHRFEIYNYLMTEKNHPSAERIFKDLKAKGSSISLATVYNSLDIFSRNGLLQVLSSRDNVFRHYDADTSPHIHFRCEKCRTIIDMHHDIDFKEILKNDRFKIMDYTIFIKGLCENCHDFNNNNL